MADVYRVRRLIEPAAVRQADPASPRVGALPVAVDEGGAAARAAAERQLVARIGA